MSATVAEATCPACGESLTEGARFCESCGSPLTVEDSPETATASSVTATSVTAAADADAAASVALCTACGAGDGVDPDGFCLACGRRTSRPRDHLESDLGWAGAVSDKGPRKVRNEDAYALDRLGEGGFVVAVGDGVSNIARSDEAAQGACDTAVATVISGPSDDDDALMVAAARHAAAVVDAMAETPVGPEPPSCTFLAVSWRPGGPIVAAWIGDCRAYWLTASGVSQLTVDHSWGSEAVATGRLTQAEADSDGRSHAITRWLGADAPGDTAPDIARVTPEGPGVLVACSDGAWNYLTGAEHLAAFVAAEDPMGSARRIVSHAITAGGHDNITAVVVSVPLRPSSPRSPVEDP